MSALSVIINYLFLPCVPSPLSRDPKTDIFQLELFTFFSNLKKSRT